MEVPAGPRKEQCRGPGHGRQRPGAVHRAVHHQHGQAGAAISGVAEPTHRRPELRGGGAILTVPSPPISTDTTPDGGAATLTPTIQFQEQVALADNKAGDTVSGGGGWTIPIIGVDVSGQVTHDVGKGHQEQAQATITDSYTLSFTAKVVLPKPETVDPSTAPPLVVLFAVDSDATASDEDAITSGTRGSTRSCEPPSRRARLRSICSGKRRPPVRWNTTANSPTAEPARSRTSSPTWPAPTSSSTSRRPASHRPSDRARTQGSGSSR